VVALILYGSFYPWRFHATALPANPLWILLHSWPDTFDRFFYRDAVVNFTLYSPFGVFCCLSFSFVPASDARTRLLRGVATILAAVALSSSIEMTQLFEPQRVCSLFDVFCNTAGAATGTVIAMTFPRAISGVVSEAEMMGVLRLSGVAALLYLFAGYELFPFFPALSRYLLQQKLAMLFGAGGWPVRDFFESLSGWLGASALLEALMGSDALAGSESATWIAALALLAIPLKLLIAQRTMTGTELLGALLGVACWTVFRRLRRGHLPAAMLAVTALVIAGLTPFRFASQAQTFTWVPFLAMLESPWETAFLVLLGKSFLYGSAVWLIKESGCGWLASTLLVAIPLAGVEAMQVWLPGRTAEITDPVLAILMGCGLMLMERRAVTAPSHLPVRASLL
jgi:VanZ family protein